MCFLWFHDWSEWSEPIDANAIYYGMKIGTIKMLRRTCNKCLKRQLKEDV